MNNPEYAQSQLTNYKKLNILQPRNRELIWIWDNPIYKSPEVTLFLWYVAALFEVELPYDPFCPSVGRFACSVCHNFLKRSGSYTFMLLSDHLLLQEKLTPLLYQLYCREIGYQLFQHSRPQKGVTLFL